MTKKYPLRLDQAQRERDQQTNTGINQISTSTACMYVMYRYVCRNLSSYQTNRCLPYADRSRQHRFLVEEIPRKETMPTRQSDLSSAHSITISFFLVSPLTINRRQQQVKTQKKSNRYIIS